MVSLIHSLKNTFENTAQPLLPWINTTR